MNCQGCREEVAAYLEGLLDEMCKSQVESHLAECSACQTEFQEVRELTAQLVHDVHAVPSVSLEADVMDRIFQEQALELRRLKMRKRFKILGLSGAMAAAVVMLLVSSFWVTQPAMAEKAAQVLARGAEAMSNSFSVHIVAKMRQHFPNIFPDAAFVPVEVWKQFGDKPKWRVEQPDGIVAMDGTSTVGFWPPNLARRLPIATEGAFNTEPLLELANVQGMVADELHRALAQGWDLKLTHEITPAGEKKLLVTVEARAALPDSDYRKNTSYYDSDMRRVYRFDAKTQRLEGADFYLHRWSGGEVLLLTIERIEYDQPIDPTTFSLKLPENVFWIKDPEPLADNEKYEKMTPKEVVRAFFNACARKDWDETQKFRTTPWSKGSQEYYGGLEIVSIGEPFQSASDIGKGDDNWFIPYEIKLKNGDVLKHNLAIRKYKSAKRYIVVGGI